MVSRVLNMRREYEIVRHAMPRTELFISERLARRCEVGGRSLKVCEKSGAAHWAAPTLCCASHASNAATL
jgi:hypothetical protein